MIQIEEHQLPSYICGTINLPKSSSFLSLHYSPNGDIILSYLVNPMLPRTCRKIYCFYAYEILEDQNLSGLTFLGNLPRVSSDNSLTQCYFFETTTSEGV